MSESDFPLKVVCPECNAAVTAKCHEFTKPLTPDGYRPFITGFRFVDWFHFARIEKAKEEGYGND